MQQASNAKNSDCQHDSQTSSPWRHQIRRYYVVFSPEHCYHRTFRRNFFSHDGEQGMTKIVLTVAKIIQSRHGRYGKAKRKKWQTNQMIAVTPATDNAMKLDLLDHWSRSNFYTSERCIGFMVPPWRCNSKEKTSTFTRTYLSS